MANNRIKDLPDEVSVGELQTLINSLYFAVDDSTFSDAEKILLKTILTEAIVANNTNNYQAMTPKSFYDSVMTGARNGIGRYATGDELTAKEGIGLIKSENQALIQVQWIQDWFVANGVPNVYYRNAEIDANQYALSFAVNIDLPFTAGVPVTVSPALPVGKIIRGAYYNAITVVARGSEIYTATDSLKYAGIELQNLLGSITPVPSGIYIGIRTGGASLYVKSLVTLDASISMNVNLILV